MSKNKVKILCLGAKKQIGKDTLCQLLKEINPKFKRVALADALKSKMSGFCYELFRKMPEQLDSQQKEMLRPLLIEAGRLARSVNINYWCEQLVEQIEIYDSTTANAESIYVITDMRYLNEFNYFKKIYGDSMIFINIERDGAPEPTTEEKNNAPELQKFADFNLNWHTDETLVSLRPIAREIYSKFF